RQRDPLVHRDETVAARRARLAGVPARPDHDRVAVRRVPDPARDRPAGRRLRAAAAAVDAVLGDVDGSGPGDDGQSEDDRAGEEDGDRALHGDTSLRPGYRADAAPDNGLSRSIYGDAGDAAGVVVMTGSVGRAVAAAASIAAPTITSRTR